MAGHRGRQRGARGGRQIVHRVKLTHAHERELQHRAAAAGVTVARYMVEAALSRGGETPAAKRALRSEFLRAKAQVVGVARNVNQIAAVANGEGRLAAGADEITDVIYATVARLDAAVRRLEA